MTTFVVWFVSPKDSTAQQFRLPQKPPTMDKPGAEPLRRQDHSFSRPCRDREEHTGTRQGERRGKVRGQQRKEGRKEDVNEVKKAVCVVRHVTVSGAFARRFGASESTVLSMDPAMAMAVNDLAWWDQISGWIM